MLFTMLVSCEVATHTMVSTSKEDDVGGFKWGTKFLLLLLRYCMARRYAKCDIICNSALNSRKEGEMEWSNAEKGCGD
jgi:hypothetical protein